MADLQFKNGPFLFINPLSWSWCWNIAILYLDHSPCRYTCITNQASPSATERLMLDCRENKAETEKSKKCLDYRSCFYYVYAFHNGAVTHVDLYLALFQAQGRNIGQCLALGVTRIGLGHGMGLWQVTCIHDVKMYFVFFCLCCKMWIEVFYRQKCLETGMLGTVRLE